KLGTRHRGYGRQGRNLDAGAALVHRALRAVVVNPDCRETPGPESIFSRTGVMDSGLLAEPVIGLRDFGRARWLDPGMTTPRHDLWPPPPDRAASARALRNPADRPSRVRGVRRPPKRSWRHCPCTKRAAAGLVRCAA